ncbi:transcription initiation factor, partial [Blastocladiella britannica]
RQKLSELVSQIDPAQRCEQDVANLLLELADEFVASTTRFACDLAKHRSSSTVEVKDLQLYI